MSQYEEQRRAETMELPALKNSPGGRLLLAEIEARQRNVVGDFLALEADERSCARGHEVAGAHKALISLVDWIEETILKGSRGPQPGRAGFSVNPQDPSVGGNP